MVDSKKHMKQKHMKNMEAAKKDLPDVDENMLFMLRYFYTTETLSGDIMEFIPEKFEKDFDELDVMNVAIFTLHGIITAATSNDENIKAVVKSKLSGMIDNEYNLNEWLFTIANETKAHDNAIYECIKSGNLDNIDAVVDKAVKEANYKAWKDELKVIKRNATAEDRINNAIGGA